MISKTIKNTKTINYCRYYQKANIYIVDVKGTTLISSSSHERWKLEAVNLVTQLKIQIGVTGSTNINNTMAVNTWGLLQK